MNMKKMKNIITMLAAAALLFMAGSNSFKAQAAEPVTYSVKYMPDAQDWEYRANTSEFEDPDVYRELYYMKETLKDGDLVVVYYDGSADPAPILDLGNVRLSNLTVAQSDGLSIIYAGYIDECFLLAGTASSINSDINTLYVYDSITCNLNKNVNELRLSFIDEDEMHSNIGCMGTVEHFYAASEAYSPYDLYHFAKGSFYLLNGDLETPEEKYSKTASSSAPQQTPAPPSSSATEPSNSAATSSAEYDHVPKTGNSSPVLWLLCTAVLCLGGYLGLKHFDTL